MHHKHEARLRDQRLNVNINAATSTIILGCNEKRVGVLISVNTTGYISFGTPQTGQYGYPVTPTLPGSFYIDDIGNAIREDIYLYITGGGFCNVVDIFCDCEVRSAAAYMGA